MHKIKTVLRLASLGLSQRKIALSCQLGQATVSDYLRMAAEAGLKWPDIADWDEDRLRAALTPSAIPLPNWRKTDEPDYAEIRRELQTHKHLTLQCSGRSTAKSSLAATVTAATAACTATG